VTRWRLIGDDGAGAAAGLATDEALMLEHGRGAKPSCEATLRLYTYRPHCALVGRFQSLEDEIDLDAARELGIEVGRRPTGGGAIIMGDGQLGVAVMTRAPTTTAPRELLERYADGVVAGLARLGIDARFRGKNDLEVDGRKVAGLGLYVDERGALLFHASVLVDLDVALMLRVLKIPGAKLSDKGIARVEERVTTARRETGAALTTSEVRNAVAAGFVEALGIDPHPSRLSAAEEARRDELIAERYGSDDWIGQHTRLRDERGTAVLKTSEGLVRIYVATHGATVKSALVAGDFNVIPPRLAALEAALRWCPATHERICELTEANLRADDLGVPPIAVAEKIWEATTRAIERAAGAHPARPEGSCYFPERIAASAQDPPALAVETPEAVL
jgi:lipoate---protein ligase